MHQDNIAKKPAILWEGENGTSRVITYADLYTDVCKFANVLKSLGVKKGDRVTIYLPMVPELPNYYACLCQNRCHPYSCIFWLQCSLIKRQN